MKFRLLLSLLIISAAAYSQDLTASLDALMNAQFKPNEPGAVALVAKGGKVIYRKAFGMADLEHDVPLKPESIFEIGSITKQFTAVSILMLVEEGKLSLDDPLTKWIEDYPMGKQPITIHHLLTHTSGIKSYTGMEKWATLWRQDMTPREMIGLFKNEPVEFAPGERWAYNNSAYFLLGYIIERASGMPYPDFLEKRIFQPLGMRNSYYGSKSRIIKNRALGYQQNDTYVNAEYLSMTQPYAAGSIMSSVDDLLTWNNAVHAGKLVKKATLQKAFTDYKLNDGKSTHYGYGWGLNDINGSSTIEHSGGIFGYNTNGIYLPAEDVFVAVFSNCNCRPPDEVSTRMAAVAIGKPYPALGSGITIDAGYMNTLAGVYDFEDGSSRIITVADGQLYSQRSGGPRFKIFAMDKYHFFYEEGFTQLQFAAQAGSREVIFKNRVNTVKGVKTDKPIPVRTAITLAPGVLKRYVGTYAVQPGVNFTISLDGGHLMSQVTGQPKVELFAESETKFFLKEVDAQVEFVTGSDGNVKSLILYQGGAKIEGQKMNE